MAITKTKWLLGVGSILFVLVSLVLLSNYRQSIVTTEHRPANFDGSRAYTYVEQQIAFGPRYPGSAGHIEIRVWLIETLQKAGWQIEEQQGTFVGKSVFNIIAFREKTIKPEIPWVIIGAHYDTRQFADRDPDPDLQRESVPGANDGASGVAVLLELAKVLPAEMDKQVWLVFFDAEDNGGLGDWDWAAGSQVFAEGLVTNPDAVVIVDMVGDADQQIYIEGNSTLELVDEIWQVAESLGVGVFRDETGYSLTDDHTPFLVRGIPAVDIIDFGYPYWHTTQDTLDKISPVSLQNVGDVVLAWILQSHMP